MIGFAWDRHEAFAAGASLYGGDKYAPDGRLEDQPGKWSLIQTGGDVWCIISLRDDGEVVVIGAEGIERWQSVQAWDSRDDEFVTYAYYS